ncbi:hypothetical protein D187_002274 [Cystobacter fuscus DSM 2262]|uniref:EF-hand domain-containing protein n=1 Tax=Cystobacter fuscus (strain ATCC 25194 / DSM 2262 / NBRC 100088 / M29) TaxID=1242864 RepID=S9QU80_CYSF2|nr:hypothetical protein [Cystobacter fuscus]EPX60188.1 hypothetical protein D187_002274 [Cystobacter fuscus DSM 2262]
MLISYPLLSASQRNASEQARLQHMLNQTRSDEGIYPVTVGNRWHGGIHLEPESENEPIRAIADGEVIAYRVAADVETYAQAQDSVGARSPQQEQDRFDTSFVLLKHTTNSGENTRVVFYSLYMHLRSRGQLTAAQLAQLPAFLRNSTPGPNAVSAPANTRVWRKEVLGFAGVLYGQRRVHFEIFATDSDFSEFWRDRTTIAQGGHGSDDVFGDMHFIIPADRTFAARHPQAVAPHRINLGGNVFYNHLPVGQAGQNTGQALHVVVNLSEGRRTATTFRVLADGRREQLGQPVVQDDYEHELYRLASALYVGCVSAGFEYLRFGRVLGPDRTTRTENWQLIRYSDTAMGYINLAAAANNVSVLSDADFALHWQRLDEGQTARTSDGICDVPTLLNLIGQPPDTNNDGEIDKNEFANHASREDIAETLRFLICKHPSEWDASDLATRYARQREAGGPLQEQSDWDQFEAHVNRMAFWSQTPLATDRSTWHFHPLQFIHHYRKCLWLNESEAVQCLPRSFVAEDHRSRTIYRSTIGYGTARTRINNILADLNKMMRKHAITSTHRISCFLANAIVESQYLNQYYEGGRGAGHTYADWYGRGIIQLTHMDGYLRYFEWRGRQINNAQQNIVWRDAVETNNYDRTESAGYWWSKNRANRTCGSPQPNVQWSISICNNFDFRQHRCTSAMVTETHLSNPALDLVGRHVNTGSPTTTNRMNGLPERRDVFTNVQAVVTDTLYPDAQGTDSLAFPSFMTRQIR